LANGAAIGFAIGLATENADVETIYAAVGSARPPLLDVTPELIAIVTIDSFCPRSLEFGYRLAETYLDELDLGPAELSALTGLFVLPWTIKPLLCLGLWDERCAAESERYSGECV
jgi:hypothetical protein